MSRKCRICCRPLMVLQGFLILMILSTGLTRAAGQQLSAAAMDNFKAQLQTLNVEKQALTPVQCKINHNIVRHLHTKVLKDHAETLPQLETGVELNSNNEILTDIKANVTDSLLEKIKANGGTIINQFPQYHAIRALFPLTVVEIIAADPDVQFIDNAAKAETHKLTTSEGGVSHNAPLVRASGYQGAGIKVGVLSDSVDNIATVKASGDLPSSVTVLQDDPGNSGEGTAMLEIVYDLAPSASLYFATAFGSPANFANNIIALKNAGCKVIVDDVGYFNESPFQDDVISQAVSTVTAAGVLYFSSAANSGNVHSNTSGTWEGDYVAGAAGPYTGTYLHVFSSGVSFNQITKPSSKYTLFWSDPLGGSSNDYDLYIVNSAGTILALSEDLQDGTQDPYELIDTNTDYMGDYLVINKYAGDARFLHLASNRGRINYNTTGEIHGHSTVDAAFSVAATSAHNRATAFTGTEPVETFSSDGPRRIFYNADGSAITPGNFLHTGGRVRQKTDIMAADGVACSAPGFSSFYGTSAAAPHAAAIAALLLSSGADYTKIRDALTSTALPSATWNNYSGYGIIMADRALAALAQYKKFPWPLFLPSIIKNR